MSHKKKQYDYNFITLIQFIVKWKKHLAIITLSAMVLSYFFSSPIFIRPKFKSTAVFYPGTTNSVSSALFYTIKDRARDPLAFGEQENVEQYMQMLQSTHLSDAVQKKFNLMEHYRINPDDKKALTRLGNKYAENVTISRTHYNSIEVNVLDEDPKLAADIANGIMFGVDSLKREIQRKVAREAFTIVEQEYLAKIATIDSLKNVTKLMGENGIYNVEEQSKGLSELIGKGASNAFTDKERKNLGSYSGEYISINEQLIMEADNLTELRRKYSQAQIDMNSNLSNIFVVSYASPSEEKAYPIKSIIVLLAAISAFAVGCIAIIILERYKSLKELLAEKQS